MADFTPLRMAWPTRRRRPARPGAPRYAALAACWTRLVRLGVWGVTMAMVTLLAGVAAAHAGEARPLATDPQLERRMLAIAEDMRCLECQNETLAASRAGLAVDLRNEIRRMLSEGQSEAQIIEFMVARYGDFVLYKPPFKPATWLLWLGPFALLIAALATLWRIIRVRSSTAGQPPLTPGQQQEASRLLAAARKELSS